MEHDMMNSTDMMPGMDHGGMMAGMAGMQPMRMTFYFGLNLMLLFDAWQIHTVGELVGAIAAVFFMAVFYEGLKTLRELLIFLHVRQQKKICPECSTPADGDKNDTLDYKNDYLEKESQCKCSRRRRALVIGLSMHVVQSGLHVIQIGYGYLLMLVAMTYNGWLLLSVCFGAGVGYLLFARGRSLMRNFQEQNECCN